MRIQKKFIYMFVTINIIVNCVFAVPAGASVNMAPAVITTLINDIKVTGDAAGVTATPKEGNAAGTENATGAGDATATGDKKEAEDAKGAAATVETDNTMEEEDDESIWYSPDIPMKKEHQRLLRECCRQKGLDYIDMLALISLESNFKEKCSNNKCKGYFQISTIHAATLSKALKTPNNPLDGTVNIKWGTTLFSWILADKRVKGLEGKERLDVALSIYQRGAGGYDKYGLNKKYLKKFYEKRDKIAACFEK